MKKIHCYSIICFALLCNVATYAQDNSEIIADQVLVSNNLGQPLKLLLNSKLVGANQLYTFLYDYARKSQDSRFTANAIDESKAARLDQTGIDAKGNALASSAVFRAQLSSGDSDLSGGKLSNANPVDILTRFQVDAKDVGELADILFVARYNGSWFHKTPNGWSPWDLTLKGLAVNTPHTLLNVDDFVVEPGLTLQGDFELYVGYLKLKNGDVVYSATPIKFSITAASLVCNSPLILQNGACVSPPQGGPSISTIQASSIGQNGALISWNLNEVATGQVEYGTTTNYGSFSIKENSFKFSSHAQQLSNLNPSTTYHFRIHSINQNGLESISTDQTFTTLDLISNPQLPKNTGSCLTPPASSIEVNVKSFGAKGDGVTNDTVSFQNAVNAVAGTGGTVIVPDGNYLVRPIFLKNNMNFKMSSKTFLQAIGFKNGDPINIYTSDILIIERVSNINISGGTLIGERNNHEGNGGEFGDGIMFNVASNITVENVVSRDNWNDGFFVYADNKNIRLCSVTADNNRRQGVSVVMADGVLIKDSAFINTNGTPPAAGIDLEPDGPDRNIPLYFVKNVTISNCILKDNQGNGLLIATNNGPVSDVTVTGTVAVGNRGEPFWAGNASGGYSQDQLNRLNIHIQF